MYVRPLFLALVLGLNAFAQHDTDPQDIPARLRLLREYLRPGSTAAIAETREARRKQILWLIENRPDLPALSEPITSINRTGDSLADQDGYAQADKLWRTLLDKADVNPDAIANAIYFYKLPDPSFARKVAEAGMTKFPNHRRIALMKGTLDAVTILGGAAMNLYGQVTIFDPAIAKSDEAVRARKELQTSTNAELVGGAGFFLVPQRMALIMKERRSEAEEISTLAENCFKRAIELEPGGRWPSGLRMMYQTRAAEMLDPGEKAALLEKALRTPATDLERSYLLADLSEAHVNIGKLDQAKAEAEELLRIGAEYPKDWNFGNSVHYGNITLGRIALKNGDTAEASRRLLAAGATPGSPQLNSFGPKWTLAQELLAKGESGPVLEYIDECRRFWKMEDGRLNAWASTIRTGGVPNFYAPPVKARPDIIGKSALDFRLHDLVGKEVTLESYRGKPVLLDFWATWCEPCRQELPSFEKLHRESSKEIAILTVNVGESPDVVRNFINKEKYTLPVLLNEDQSVAKKYGVNAYPTLAVIDASGKVADYLIGSGPNPEQFLKSAIAKAKNGALPSAAASRPARTAEEYFREAVRFEREKNYDAAITSFDNALGVKPGWIHALRARSLAYYNSKRYDDAIRDLDELIRQDPKNAMAYDRRGLSYSYSGRHARAIEDYTRSIELAPQAAAPYNNRGWAYLSMGRLNEALADLNKAIELDPSYQLAFENRINLLIKLKEFEKAKADCDAVLEMNPAATWATSRKAEIDKLSGNAPAPLSNAAPKLTAPPEGAVFDHFPRKTTLVWARVSGATSYLVQVDFREPKGWNSELYGRDLPAFETTDPVYDFNFVGAQPGRWRVWAKFADGSEGPKSEWRGFRYTR